MTPLERLIRAEITATGPMPILRYMELCLAHPEHGYYVTRDPLGAAGDFTTAPEISQMFGEMIGVWVAAVATGFGPFRLVELGPGRGTLMADALRVLTRAGMTPEVWMVETSPALRAEQAARVPGAHWAASLDEVPDGPAVILANEFFDALPVRQYVFGPEGGREIMVGLDTGGLTTGLSAPFQAPGAPPGWDEFCPAAEAVARGIATRLTAHPGALLAIDYGFTAADRPAGPTLQAVKGHEKVGILTAPGQCDLTSLVDFDRLAATLAPLRTQVTEQGAFLARLGIGARAQGLAETRPTEADAIADALDRLTAPDQMGRLFRALGAVSPGLPAPPGFEDP